MRHIKRFCLTLSIIMSITFLNIQNCYAATVTVTANQSKVYVGSKISVTITVPSNAANWVYKIGDITYSSNLSLVSGEKQVEGYQYLGDSRTSTFIFQAKSVGKATVSINRPKGMSVNDKDVDIDGSASFDIVAVSNPTPTPTPGTRPTTKPTPTPTPDTRSSKNSLVGLTLSEGTLSPAFDSSTTNYSVSLPAKTTSINVSATPSDSKAKVKGTGDIALQPGANTIKVVVTAENGTDKTYTITANVDEAPIVYTDLDGTSLGVVRNTKDLTIPEGFAETTVTLEGEQVKAWTNETMGITLVYLVDEGSNAAFYVYSPDKGVVCQYAVLQFNGKNYVFAGIDESLREMQGLTYGKVDAFDKTIDGFAYNDENLSSFKVLYLMDEDGQYGYYNYDTDNKTLQLFSGAVYSPKQLEAMETEKKEIEKELHSQILIRNISIGAAIAFMAISIVLGFMMNNKDKKIRKLRRRGGSSNSQE